MGVPRRATVLDQQLAAIRRFFRRVVVNLRESPNEAFNMGVLAEGQGDPEGAKAAYQWAIDSGHAKWAPMAAVHLGLLLAGQGDHEGAKASLQWAIASGHLDTAPMAAASDVQRREQGPAPSFL
jgi:hypothetical protein